MDFVSSCIMERKIEEETVYHSKDFEWDELREEIENDPSLAHHLLPFSPPCSSSSSSAPPPDSDSWKSFHRRHSTGKFFKERRYLLKEFPELLCGDEHCKILEVGCGNGSSVLPILRGNHRTAVYACDCSSDALERAKEMIHTADPSLAHRFHPFICDFSQFGLPNWFICDLCRASSPNSTQSRCCIGEMDFVTLIFTLSAIPFQMMPKAIGECFSVLRPGGVLLFRDYGLYDMTMLRFQPGKRVGFREYVRSDGTRSYFFCLDTVRKLFGDVGFVELELDYCCVKSMNRRHGKSMRRVWVHGKFQKPLCNLV